MANPVGISICLSPPARNMIFLISSLFLYRVLSGKGYWAFFYSPLQASGSDSRGTNNYADIHSITNEAV
jgi:hypothetical protein